MFNRQTAMLPSDGAVTGAWLSEETGQRVNELANSAEPPSVQVDRPQDCNGTT